MKRFLLAVLVLLAFASPTVASEAICQTAPVFFCDDFGDQPTGTMIMSLATFKNQGWQSGGGTFQIVTSPAGPTGTTGKIFQLTTPADNSGSFMDTGGPAWNGHPNGIYVRWYERHQGNYIFANTSIPNSVGVKNFELDLSVGGASFFMAATAPIPNYVGQASFNQLRDTFHGTKFGNTNNDLFQNRNTPAFRLAGDTWNCYEIHIGYPMTNGTFEGWVDGVLRWQYTNTLLYNQNATVVGILFSGYWNGSEGFPNSQMPAGTHPQMSKWLKNVVASEAPIGCIGAASPTPNAPTNPRVVP